MFYQDFRRNSKARLLTPLVDLLLDGFSLLIDPNNGPGIAVSTLPELAAALSLEVSGIDYPGLPEDERSRLIRPACADSRSESTAVCVSADGPPVVFSLAGKPQVTAPQRSQKTA